MSNFDNRPLKVLGRIFRFVGGDAISSRVSLAAGATPVIDVSRQAELGAAGEVGFGGGYWVATTHQVHTGAGFIRDAITVFDGGSATRVNGYEVLPDEWVFAIAEWGQCTNVTTFTSAAVAIAGVPLQVIRGMHDAGNVSAVPFPLSFWDTANADLLLDTAGRILTRDSGSNVHPPIQIPRPANPANECLQFGSQCSGAATTILCALIWKGKIGTYPPGNS